MAKKILKEHQSVAIVTGARGVLGSSVIRNFLAKGRRVVGCDLEVVSKQSIENDPNEANLRWVHMDVTQTESVKRSLDLIWRQGYQIDTLVHCAGGFRFNFLEKTTDADLDFLLNVNLKSAFLVSRELLPEMRKNGFGRMVFISSETTFRPVAGMTAYSAAKAGLNSFVKSLADEVKGLDITVNAILPSIIDTPLNRKAMPKWDFSKWVHPDQLAEIIVNLVGDLGRPIHGALIPVTGRV